MNKKLLAFGLVSLFAMFTAGCWDIRDVNNRAYVTAIGLDKVEEASATGYPPPRYTITFEIINPAQLKRQSNQPATVVETVQAESIRDAIEHVQSSVPRTITLSHMSLILVGEDLARERNFNDLLNFFEKNPQLAMRLRIGFVEGGTAKDILNARPRFESSMAGEFVAMADLNRDYSLARVRSFYQFTNDLREAGGRGFITQVYLSEKERHLVREGGAVFQDWRLVGWLNDHETQAANWLAGRYNATVQVPMGQGLYIYQAFDNSAQINPVITGKDLRFVVRIKARGHLLEEQEQQIDLSGLANIEKLEREIAQVIAKQAESAIKLAQHEYGVDYLGFDQALKQSEPEYFKSLDWAEAFPKTRVTVQVESEVLSFGLAQ